MMDENRKLTDDQLDGVTGGDGTSGDLAPATVVCYRGKNGCKYFRSFCNYDAARDFWEQKGGRCPSCMTGQLIVEEYRYPFT